MAKAVTPPQAPGAAAPGAPPADEQILAPADVAPSVEPDTASTTPPEPAAESAAAPEPQADPAPPVEPGEVYTYRVNWHFLGFKGGDFHEGDTVEATEEEAAPYVGGVLTLEP